ADLELAGSRVAPEQPAEREVTSWAEAVAAFERGLLERLYARYPSSRKLSAHLGTSHTMIANKLRKYRITKA
ncbi:MAG: TyrR/PhhR family helix-turn-helix DNA-binding protein, partial [Myxococcales bacterium]